MKQKDFSCSQILREDNRLPCVAVLTDESKIGEFTFIGSELEVIDSDCPFSIQRSIE
jgi:hypothetical protein